ncbi:PLP-dependent transferase [Tilletiaria anomala UBC 951]|uniref:PLP-dependent transferase n=1 Tax=Tilletiaria anomala (strain ATCC 24038 / CBS 436.72 / UBC 951) TaxID=1037660 RepID=A0A066VGR3_TILAU|nr:PLP-dependent transferase [Tilletiaria anomala UBC 951]KDN37934.1 PLP-dependent transferase [Tilletiaria anomala UBC 951]
MGLNERLRAALDARQAKDTLRRLTRFDDPTHEDIAEAQLLHGRALSAEGRGKKLWTDFSSNDYLSFATAPAMRHDFMRRMQQYERDHPNQPLTGSSGSRLLDGNNVLAEEVELAIASHFHSESALLFNTGFSANASLLAVLPKEGDLVLYDELVHASMHDGIRKSRARSLAFGHNDMHHLDQLLRQERAAHVPCSSTARTVFIAVESVYSMDGDMCPLPSLCDTVARHVPRENRCLIVDEAHGVGVYGENGKGCTVGLGLEDAVDIRLATFGKALGCSGAAVLCSELVKAFLLNYARPLIYSTALPPSALLSIQAALHALVTPLHAENQRRVLDNAALLHQLLHGHAAPPLPSACAHHHSSLSYPSPIVPLLSPRPKALAAFLQQEGRMIVRGITYPTVPKGQDRVRICVHASNTEEDIRALAHLIHDWRRKENGSLCPSVAARPADTETRHEHTARFHALPMQARPQGNVTAKL